MAYYMLQWTFKDTQIKALVEKPQNREAEVRKVVESFGGKMHSYFFAYGKFDGVAILEFPDNEAVAACVLSVTATGPFASTQPTGLMTSGEARKIAMWGKRGY